MLPERRRAAAGLGSALVPSESDEVAHLIGHQVVVDTATPYLYIGTLKAWKESVVILESVDVHDVSGGSSGKDMYVLEARRYGVQKNRNEVTIRKEAIVSVSRLEDVINF